MPENENLDFKKIIDDIAGIMEIPSPQTPNDIAEFLMVSENRGDTIYLYDLLNYLYSKPRTGIRTAIDLNTEYFIETAGREIKDSKQRALARLECNLAGHSEWGMYSLRHVDTLDGRTFFAEPTMLLGKGIDEYHTGSEDKLVNYVVALFNNKKILGTPTLLGTLNLIKGAISRENSKPTDHTDADKASSLEEIRRESSDFDEHFGSQLMKPKQ